MGNLINDNDISLITATNFSVVDVGGKKEIDSDRWRLLQKKYR